MGLYAARTRGKSTTPIDFAYTDQLVGLMMCTAVDTSCTYESTQVRAIKADPNLYGRPLTGLGLLMIAGCGMLTPFSGGLVKSQQKTDDLVVSQRVSEAKDQGYQPTDLPVSQPPTNSPADQKRRALDEISNTVCLTKLPGLGLLCSAAVVEA